MSVLRRLRMGLACWLPMHRRSSKLHFRRGIRAAAASLELFGSTTPEPSNYWSEAKHLFVAIRSKSTAAPSNWGHDKNNAQTHATLDKLDLKIDGMKGSRFAGAR